MEGVIKMLRRVMLSAIVPLGTGFVIAHFAIWEDWILFVFAFLSGSVSSDINRWLFK